MPDTRGRNGGSACSARATSARAWLPKGARYQKRCLVGEGSAGLLADDSGLGELFAIHERGRVVERGLGDRGEGLLGEERLVARHDDVGEGAQRRGDGLDDGVRAVAEDVVVLLLVHVQAGSADLAGADALDERLGVDEAATCGVDEDHAVLHLVDGVGVDHVAVAVEQRTVQGDEVGAAKQLIELDILDHALEGGVLVDVIAEDLHAKAVADADHGGADLAGADDAGGLAVEVDAEEALEGEVILADAGVALVDAAGGAEAQADGLLCDSLRRIGRDAQDRHAEVLGDGHVDGVEAGGAHEDELHVKAAKDLERHGGGVGVDEGADCVIAASERGGDGRKVGLDVVDLDVGIVLELGVERISVVVTGVVEEDFHAA